MPKGPKRREAPADGISNAVKVMELACIGLPLKSNEIALSAE